MADSQDSTGSFDLSSILNEIQNVRARTAGVREKQDSAASERVQRTAPRPQHTAAEAQAAAPRDVPLDKQARKRYNALVSSAKALEANDNENEALVAYEEAADIKGDDAKLQAKISSLRRRVEVDRAYADEMQTEAVPEEMFDDTTSFEAAALNGVPRFRRRSGESDATAVLPHGLSIPWSSFHRLFRHQRVGVSWLWTRLRRGGGAILADDMGLGKTVQTCTFLDGAFRSRTVKRVLIVAPLSLVETWTSELGRSCAGAPRCEVFHGTSNAQRAAALRKVREGGGVLVTTYGLVQNQGAALARMNAASSSLGDGSGGSRKWDLVIIDEAHKVKNPYAATTRALHDIKATRRLLLTGTAMQNNLQELWALVDYATAGSLLGTLQDFQAVYEKAIVRGSERDSSADEKYQGHEVAQRLRQRIAPIFLRREKKDIDLDALKLGNKLDLAVWVPLSKGQSTLYRDVLGSDRVRDALRAARSPLAALSLLKKICDHPPLVPNGENVISAKLLITDALVRRLTADGMKTLVFSQSLKVLDMLASSLTGIPVVRIDGAVPPQERPQRVQQFNDRPDPSCCLLTTQVGGLGLTLTGATRVIIFDPSWNPAADDQAVDRAYRIGQRDNVVVFRLITCGTVEEKMYRRQVFKSSLGRTATGRSASQPAYFTRRDIREVFKLGSVDTSDTATQLTGFGATASHQSLVHALQSLGAAAVSDHGVLFGPERCEAAARSLADAPPTPAAPRASETHKHVPCTPRANRLQAPRTPRNASKAGSESRSRSASPQRDESEESEEACLTLQELEEAERREGAWFIVPDSNAEDEERAVRAGDMARSEDHRARDAEAGARTSPGFGARCGRAPAPAWSPVQHGNARSDVSASGTARISGSREESIIVDLAQATQDAFEDSEPASADQWSPSRSHDELGADARGESAADLHSPSRSHDELGADARRESAADLHSPSRSHHELGADARRESAADLHSPSRSHNELGGDARGESAADLHSPSRSHNELGGDAEGELTVMHNESPLSDKTDYRSASVVSSSPRQASDGLSPRGARVVEYGGAGAGFEEPLDTAPEDYSHPREDEEDNGPLAHTSAQNERWCALNDSKELPNCEPRERKDVPGANESESEDSDEDDDEDSFYSADDGDSIASPAQDRAHTSLSVPLRHVVLHPSTNCDEVSMKRVAELAERCSDARARGDLASALGAALDALDICDEDRALQEEAVATARALFLDL